MKLCLGGGHSCPEGYFNVDVNPKCNPKWIWDLEQGLPKDIAPHSVDEIFTEHCLEHINNLVRLMQNCFDVLKSGGLFKIVVPSGHNLIWALRDPTHKRIFFDQTFLYFTKTELVPSYCDFNLIKLERIKRIIKSPEGELFEMNHEIFSCFIGEDIHAILQKP